MSPQSIAKMQKALQDAGVQFTNGKRPTLACLKNLYPLVSPGGLVAFDEYAFGLI